jgi:ATP-dependent Clp protease protease subunit
MTTTALDLGQSVYQRLLAERVIFLGSEVDDEVANRLCAQMLLLAAEDPTRDIHLYINSPGGSVTSGMAILDTMRYVSCDVATYAVGLAASMGQILLTCGAKGKRHALPRARIMMHQGSAGIGGSAADIEIMADYLRSTTDEMASLLAEATGQSRAQIVRDWDRDRWFTADEALDYGIVDRIVGLPADLRER